ncbi:MAG TPA: hypothetical protein VGI32_16745, partial [Steroidobacteraceae bacterium]
RDIIDASAPTHSESGAPNHRDCSYLEFAHKERTRERVPLQWATTQNNLGKAQALLNERLRPFQKS